MPYTVEEYYGHFRPTFKTAFILIMNIFVLAVNASLGKHKKLKTAKPGCLIVDNSLLCFDILIGASNLAANHEAMCLSWGCLLESIALSFPFLGVSTACDPRWCCSHHTA